MAIIKREVELMSSDELTKLMDEIEGQMEAIKSDSRIDLVDEFNKLEQAYLYYQELRDAKND